MKDKILEMWNEMSMKDKQEALDKFSVTTLGGVMTNEKLRTYIKENIQNFKLVYTGTSEQKWVVNQPNLNSIPKSKLIRRY